MVERFKADDKEGFDAYITIAPVRVKKKISAAQARSVRIANMDNPKYPGVQKHNSKVVEEMLKNKANRKK